MHAVQCPNCRKLLRLDRPVDKARMRCRHCGQVFIGTSHELVKRPPASRSDKPVHKAPGRLTAPPAPAEPAGFASGPVDLAPFAPPPPSPPPSAQFAPGLPLAPLGDPQPAYAPPPGPTMPPIYHRRRKSVIPLIIVCVGFPAIVVVIIVASWLWSHPYQEIRDDQGNILESAHMTQEEYARKKAKWDEEIRGKAGASADSTAQAEPPAPGRGEGPKPPTVETIPPRPKRPGSEDSVADPNDMVAGDPSVLATALGAPVTRGDEDPTSGWFVGTVQNTNDFPIRLVKILVYTYDANDMRRRPAEGTCCYIPPKATVPFCVDYRGLSKDGIYKVTAKTEQPARALPSTVSWVIEPSQTVRTNQDREAIITGKVRNPYDLPLKNLKVYYDMYTAENVQINQATKTAGKAPDSLPARGEADFTITFNPGETGYSLPMVHTWVVRVWAEK